MKDGVIYAVEVYDKKLKRFIVESTFELNTYTKEALKLYKTDNPAGNVRVVKYIREDKWKVGGWKEIKYEIQT